MKDHLDGLNWICGSDSSARTLQVCLKINQKSANSANCSAVCEDSDLYAHLFTYCYPTLLLICLIGSVLNLLVYSEKRIKRSSTVRLLYAKTLVNCGSLLSLFPGMLKSVNSNDRKIEHFFWVSNPTVLFLANSFGGCSTWLTMIMTVGIYMSIRTPSRFKLYFTMRLANILIVVTLLLSFSLQLFYPITRSASLVECQESSSLRYQILSSFSLDNQVVKAYEYFYYWTNTIGVIILPFLIMAVLTVFIFARLRSTTDYGMFAEPQRFILRITILTTLAHLLLESPQSVMYFTAALGKVQTFELNCNFVIITNFLSMTNAATPFLLYSISSKNFRRFLIMHTRCGCRLNWPHNCALLHSGSENSITHVAAERITKASKSLQFGNLKSTDV